VPGRCSAATPDAVVHRVRCGKEETDEYFQAIADRVEIEALRGEFTERAYEVRYHDTTPLAGSPPPQPGRPLTRRPGTRRRKDGGDHGYTAFPRTRDPGPVYPGVRCRVFVPAGGFAVLSCGERRGRVTVAADGATRAEGAATAASAGVSGRAATKACPLIFARLHDPDPPRDLAGVSPI
jgi:hypothetical protein